MAMRTLEQLVADDGPIGVRDALGWVLRAGLALWELHADGIPHGRVSPAAILVAADDCQSEGRMLRPSELDEIPAYHSVSRADGEGPSLQDDVWALGVTLYFLLTGTLPYPKGVAAAIEGGKLRPPPPLAVHRAELDVMQPVLDRLIRIDHTVATSIEDLVFGLRDFSPTIADLPALPLERPSHPPRASAPEADSFGGQSPPSAGGQAGQARPRARRSPLESNLLYGVLVLLLGAILFVALRGDDDPPSAPAAPSPAPPATTPPATTGRATTTAAATTARAAATAAPDASASASRAPEDPTAPDPDPGARDLVACTSALFPDDAFAEDLPAMDFPCSARDAKKGTLRVTSALARGGEGRATRAAKEWAALGWYQVAAYGVMHHRCCPGSEPVVTPRLLGICKIDDALHALSSAANAGSDDALAGALDAYRAAIQCALTAGGAAYFGQRAAPTTAEAAVFLRMLTRLRASRR